MSIKNYCEAKLGGHINDTNIETEATVYSSPILKHQYPRISGEYMHSIIVIPSADRRFITIIESVDSTSRDGLDTPSM